VRRAGAAILSYFRGRYRAEGKEQGEPGHLGRSGPPTLFCARPSRGTFRKTAGSRKKRRIRPTASAGGASGSSTRSTARRSSSGEGPSSPHRWPWSRAERRGWPWSITRHGTSCSRPKRGRGPGRAQRGCGFRRGRASRGPTSWQAVPRFRPGSRTAARSGDGRIDRSVAYKLALVAAGRGDLTLSVRPKSEWDLAAGVLLVGEAGGIATDVAGDPMLFNRPEPRIAGVARRQPGACALFLRWPTPKKTEGRSNNLLVSALSNHLAPPLNHRKPVRLKGLVRTRFLGQKLARLML